MSAVPTRVAVITAVVIVFGRVRRMTPVAIAGYILLAIAAFLVRTRR